jgi:hypothetical protein
MVLLYIVIVLACSSHVSYGRIFHLISDIVVLWLIQTNSTYRARRSEKSTSPFPATSLHLGYPCNGLLSPSLKMSGTSST